MQKPLYFLAHFFFFFFSKGWFASHQIQSQPSDRWGPTIFYNWYAFRVNFFDKGAEKDLWVIRLKCEVSRAGKSTGTGGSLVAAQGWGQTTGGWLLRGTCGLGGWLDFWRR